MIKRFSIHQTGCDGRRGFDATPFGERFSNRNDSTKTSKKPVLVAHRGASGYAPEHTLAGYELARSSRAPTSSSRICSSQKTAP